MKDHPDIKQLLPAYSGGDLNAAEQKLVEEHLESCASCRADLADLRTALKIIRSTPEVEPPPWLTSRIMARLRDQEKEKRSWLQRLFFPLPIKIPLEALAVLMVCMIGYYLSQSVVPELQRPVPQQEPSAVPQPVQKAAEDKKLEPPPAASRPEHVIPRNEAPKATKQAVPAEQNTPASPPPVYAPNAPTPEAPPAYAPAPPKSFKEERAASGAGAGYESKGAAPAAQSYDRVPDTSRKMKKAAPRMERQAIESRASEAEKRSDMAGAPASKMYRPQVTVRLSLEDPTSADNPIRQAIARSGGTVVEEGLPIAERKLKARIPATSFAGLIDSLRRLGRISEQPATPDSAGNLEVVIVW